LAPKFPKVKFPLFKL